LGSGSRMYRPNARQTPSKTVGRDVTFHFDSIQNHFQALDHLFIGAPRRKPPFVTAMYSAANISSSWGVYTEALAARRAVSLLWSVRETSSSTTVPTMAKTRMTPGCFPAQFLRLTSWWSCCGCSQARPFGCCAEKLKLWIYAN
jgi:hypothetical protein